MTQHSDFRLEVKFLAETGTFEGYGSVFNVVDNVNDKIAPGAFQDSLALHKSRGTLPPLLWQHEHTGPIGAWREMYEDDHGLYVRGDLFINDIPLAKEAHKLLKEGVVTGLSIGYRTRESHREQKSGVRVLTKLDLIEVSLVTFPANEFARVSGVKRLFSPEAPPTMREFEAYLRNSGLSRRQAKGVVAQGYKALASREQGLIDSLQRATADTWREINVLRLNRALKQATAEIYAKYSPDQPRDDHGRWTDEGGDAGIDQSNINDPPIRPVYPVENLLGVLAGGPAFVGAEEGKAALGVLGEAESAVHTAEALTKLTPSEADMAAVTVRARAVGKPLARLESDPKIKEAADSIEKHLGGKPEYTNPNKSGDAIFMKGGRKIRYDSNNSHGDQKHFHIERQTSNGNWKRVNGHRYYFKNEG